MATSGQSYILAALRMLPSLPQAYQMIGGRSIDILKYVFLPRACGSISIDKENKDATYHVQYNPGSVPRQTT